MTFATLFDVVETCARESGDVVAAIDGIRQEHQEPVLPPALSYRELRDASARVAVGLAARLGAELAAEPAALATWLPRGIEWYCTFLAAAKLSVPVAALSTDLRDKEVERRRNLEMLTTMKASLMVVAAHLGQWQANAVNEGPAADALGDLPTATFRALWAAGEGPVPGTGPGCAAGGLENTLCLCFTGGTTKASRCVRVTHGMALHEVTTYPHVAKLQSTDRVLQQHSVYWGASAYGELDIALAFRCALVFCEAGDTDGLARALQEHEITCAGLVPSVLGSLDPALLPRLRLVFTWGEALGQRTAREWARRARVVDLLISTECWLALYAVWEPDAQLAHGERPPFRTVPGVSVRPDAEGDEQVQGRSTEVGELLVAGPMVMPGYTSPELNEDAFLREEDGVRWYRTRDRVQRLPCGGLAFAGRADDLVKVGGVWLDTNELACRLGDADSVAEACVDGGRAFVALVRGPLPPGTVPALRRLLPQGFALVVVPRLPRRAGTNKVDRAELARLANAGIAAQLEAEEAEETARCRAEFAKLRSWYMPLCALGLGAAVHAAIACRGLESEQREVCGQQWQFEALLERLAAFSRRFALELSWRVSCTAYAALLPWRMEWSWQRAAHKYVPGGFGGALLLANAALPAPVCLLVALPGASCAAYRGRLLSWPIVCAFGFPIWARDAGGWWVKQGRRGTFGWYKRLATRSLKPMASFSKKVLFSVQRHLGLVKPCAACKAVFPITGGHTCKEDGHWYGRWYCDGCWSDWDWQRQCSSCRAWSARGQWNADGAWSCSRCARQQRQRQQQQQQQQQQQPLPPPPPPPPPPLRRPPQLPARPPSAPPQQPQPRPQEQEEEEEGWQQQQQPLQRPWLWPQPQQEEEGRQQQQQQQQQQQEQPVHHRDIRFRSSVTELLCAGAGQQPPTDDPAADGRAGAAVGMGGTTADGYWQLIEQHTGWTFQALDTSIGGLDSLRVAKVTSALRRKTGKPVTHELFRRCATLGDLLRELRQLPVEDCGSQVQQNMEFATWGLMWQSKCSWLLRRDEPVPEPALRTALAALVARHPCLRARPVDTLALYSASQKALTVLGLWWRSSCPGLPPRLAGAACRVARWGFRNAWPRAATGPVPTAAQLPLEVLPLQQTANLAKEALQEAQRFAPPFRAALVAFGKDGQPEGALLQLQVTHMFSDGFSIVPLLADLGHLLAQAEGAPLPPLAPVPSSLTALENRLVRTINGDESMRDIITPEPLVRAPTRDKVTIFATLPEFEVTALKRHARALGISVNAVMLTAISVGLAYLEEMDSVPVVLVVPQRDGPAESDLVGLFADFRLLRVSCGGLSAVGVALQLHHLIRDRLWLVPGPFTQFSHPWVNFQWTDFEAHHGLRQINDLGTWPGHLSNPIGVVVEQPDELSWRLRANFDAKKYGPDARERFFEGLARTMEALASDPMAPAWPPVPAAEGSEQQGPPATAAAGSEHEGPRAPAAHGSEQQGPPATVAVGSEHEGPPAPAAEGSEQQGPPATAAAGSGHEGPPAPVAEG